jgi:Flp pilus assembly pilin Flp
MRFLDEVLLRLMCWEGSQLRVSDEKGQTLAEYGLIMAVIAVAVVVTAVTLFRGAIITAFNSATGCLDGTC